MRGPTFIGTFSLEKSNFHFNLARCVTTSIFYDIMLRRRPMSSAWAPLEPPLTEPLTLIFGNGYLLPILLMALGFLAL